MKKRRKEENAVMGEANMRLCATERESEKSKEKNLQIKLPPLPPPTQGEGGKSKEKERKRGVPRQVTASQTKERRGKNVKGTQ